MDALTSGTVCIIGFETKIRTKNYGVFSTVTIKTENLYFSA